MKKKTKKENLILGIVAITFSQIIVKILGLVYKMYLTNHEGFGDAGNAIYGSGFQIYTILLTISSIGVPSAIAKLISAKLAIGDNRGAHRIFKVCFVIFSLIGIGGSTLLFVGAGFISKTLLQIPEAELTLVTLSPSVFFVTISSVIKGYFNGRGELKATAKSQTFEQIFKTIFTVAIVEITSKLFLNKTYIMAAGANLATTIATFFGMSYLFLYYKLKSKEIWQDVNLSEQHRLAKAKTIIRQILMLSVPITFTALLGALTKNIDAITVVRGLKNIMTEAEAKTQYGILTGKIDTLVMFPLSLNIALSIAIVPKISSLNARRKLESINNKISYAILLTELISIPSTVRHVCICKTNLRITFS
ncbi:MAG: oligosaccharide flippase family protein [Clostridia bacterium]|nr:oligosaccharide flippase family protein [Clostridia bacterium]